MQQILVYADSLSWGIIPATRQRLPFDARWPGVMEKEQGGHSPRHGGALFAESLRWLWR